VLYVSCSSKKSVEVLLGTPGPEGYVDVASTQTPPGD